jgi:hypothetical protein
MYDPDKWQGQLSRLIVLRNCILDLGDYWVKVIHSPRSEGAGFGGMDELAEVGLSHPSSDFEQSGVGHGDC